MPWPNITYSKYDLLHQRPIRNHTLQEEIINRLKSFNLFRSRKRKKRGKRGGQRKQTKNKNINEPRTPTEQDTACVDCGHFDFNYVPTDFEVSQSDDDQHTYHHNQNITTIVGHRPCPYHRTFRHLTTTEHHTTPHYHPPSRPPSTLTTVQQLDVNSCHVTTFPSATKTPHSKMSKRTKCERKDGLTIYHMNARSVGNKTALINHYIIENNVDILFITESWLKENDDSTINDLTPEGYSVIKKHRKGKKGGGILVIFKSNITIKSVQSDTFDSFEHQVVDVNIKGQHYKMVCVYRPPKNNIAEFLTDYHDLSTSLALQTTKLLILGDFNLHIDKKTDPSVKQFMDNLKSLNLKQLINEPTHEQGHTLDLLICGVDNDFISSVTIDHDGPADHSIITCTLQHTKPKPIQRKILTRKTKNIDIQKLHQAITLSDITNKVNTVEGVEQKLKIFEETLFCILEKFAPLERKTITIRPNTDWFNEEIRQAKHRRRKAEKKWRSSRLEIDRQIYRDTKQLTNKLISECKQNHVRNAIKTQKDSKGMFKLINGMIRTQQSAPQLPTFDCPQKLTETFSNFFIDKVAKIRDELDSQEVQTTTISQDKNNDVSLLYFEPASKQEILQILTVAPNKTCSLDVIPTWLIKKFKELLAPSIMSIVNASLKDGDFPERLKKAIVRPLLKKSSLDPNNIANFRPISNLHFISKVIEKVVAKRLNDYLAMHNLLPTFQSAYRTGHSTETALLRVHNDIINSMDKGYCVLLVMLDLSAAFDTVDQSTLIRRLKNHFGISSNALKWIKSYLENRLQYVQIESPDGPVTSQSKQLRFGVPQGSVLGPLLFSIYTAPLSSLIETYGLHYHSYADDTQLYSSFQRGQEQTVKSKLEHCCLAIKEWMQENKLKLNDSKTEVLLIGTNQMRKKIKLDEIQIGDCTINTHHVTNIRNLGAYFDSTASMQTHVTKTCQSCFYHLRNISKIRHLLDESAARTIVHALVTSRMDYCNSLLLGATSQCIERLQKVQNRAARIVTKSNEPIKEILYNLHWLPITERIVFKTCTLIHRCLQNQAPAYLVELCKPYSPSRDLRSAKDSLLIIPKTRLSISKKSFSAGGPCLWNTLSSEVKKISDNETFRKHLKTELFARNYE